MNNSRQSWLSWFLRGLLSLVFLILAGKLFEIQLIKGEYYRTLSDENRIRKVSISAARGRILSRDGTALADNVEIKKRIVIDSKGIGLSEDLTNAESSKLVTDYKRVYPLGSKFAHASGYLSVVGEKEIGTVDPGCPGKGVRLSGQLIGVTGLEAEYECLLKGIPGEELIEVDTKGSEVRILGIKKPVNGQDLKTSIDYNLQKTVAEKMSEDENSKGAVIVTSAKGEVLSFYSAPSFDPNLLIDRDDSKKISALLSDTNLPFFNRASGGSFHPGSVFKPIVALGALESGVIDKNFEYIDPGIIKVREYSYTNWFFNEYGRTEGSVNLIRALARSTDTFFYKVGEMMGPDLIAKWATIFGLDKITGIDLPGEDDGFIPTPEWKQKVKKEPWFLGNTYNTSIGQGDVNTTPIQINTYISAIANNGQWCSPKISAFAYSNNKCSSLGVKKSNLEIVKEGMKEACSEGGTGYTFFDFQKKHNGISVACKTGTAEVETDGIPHAWFTFFAPMDNPEIVATVLVERGGQGSQVAGPIARAIADYFFQSTSN